MAFLRSLHVYAMAATLFSSPVSMADAETNRPASIRVVTYNIRLDTPADGTNDWSHRRALFLAQLQLLRPDILGLQEVLPAQREDLVAALPGHVALGGGRDDGDRQGEASPLFVDGKVFAIPASGMFWLSPTPDRPSLGWGAAYRRIATWAHVRRRADGLRLLVVNTHWDHVSASARLESARLLQRWTAAHRWPKERVLLIGDFNAGSSDPSVRHLLASGGAILFTDARDDAGAAAGNSASFNDFVVQPAPGEPIDHILVGDGLTVRFWHLLAEHFDGRVASDHFPVIADLAPSSR